MVSVVLLFFWANYFSLDCAGFSVTYGRSGWKTGYRTFAIGHHRFQGSKLKETHLYNGSNNDNNDSIVDDDSDSDSTGTKRDMNILTKSSWYVVELFGNVFGTSSSSSTRAAGEINQETSTLALPPPSSLDETIQRISDDNDRSYFLSGIIDDQIYDKDCVFADPFVSFSGRDRFVKNLENLGSFITKYDARVIKKNSPVVYKESIPVVETKIMVKLELRLPWKPVLAWPWGVTYEIDPKTFLITRHEEAWSIEPLEGVKMIFRPGKVKL